MKMRTGAVILFAVMLLSACSKGKTDLSDTVVYSESRAVTETDSAYSYMQYVRVKEEYADALQDYMCYLIGNVPVNAEKDNSSTETVEVYKGSGYQMEITKGPEQDLYHWAWTDAQMGAEIEDAIDLGKKVKEEQERTENEKYEGYYDETYTSEVLRPTYKADKMELKFVSDNPFIESWTYLLDESEVDKIKEWLKAAGTEVENTEMNSLYQLVLYDKDEEEFMKLYIDPDEEKVSYDYAKIISDELMVFLKEKVENSSKAIEDSSKAH